MMSLRDVNLTGDDVVGHRYEALRFFEPLTDKGREPDLIVDDSPSFVGSTLSVVCRWIFYFYHLRMPKAGFVEIVKQ